LHVLACNLKLWYINGPAWFGHNFLGWGFLENYYQFWQWIFRKLKNIKSKKMHTYNGIRTYVLMNYKKIKFKLSLECFDSTCISSNSTPWCARSLSNFTTRSHNSKWRLGYSGWPRKAPEKVLYRRKNQLALFEFLNLEHTGRMDFYTARMELNLLRNSLYFDHNFFIETPIWVI
jgi:hypothetical protein